MNLNLEKYLQHKSLYSETIFLINVQIVNDDYPPVTEQADFFIAKLQINE